MEFVHQYSTLTAGPDGQWYIVRAYADQQPGGLWEGWFVFYEEGLASSTTVTRSPASPFATSPLA